MKPSAALWIVMFLTIASVGVALDAYAHAFPNSEDPRVGSTIAKSPAKITITYDAPIESLFAHVSVLSNAGQEEVAGSPAVDSNHRTLSVMLKPLNPGDYTVKWSVVAEDGHRTEGSYDFTVGAGS
jgi:methionine-rich copper-binding protein CopC